MIIVSDTTAITSLLQIGQLEILQTLFQKVVIPPEVAGELSRFHSALPDFLFTRPVTDRSRFEKIKMGLDVGEAAAIALALEDGGDVLLMDEKSGRRVAHREGLRVIGLMGVLLLARKRGLLASQATVVEDLERVAGFRVSPQLKRRILLAAGEE